MPERFSIRPARRIAASRAGYTAAEARALLARLAPGRRAEAPSPPPTDDSYPAEWLGRRGVAGSVEFEEAPPTRAGAPQGSTPRVMFGND